jgi:hypothetical protein
MLKRLTLPAVLVVSQVVASGCSSPSPTDASTPDVADAVEPADGNPECGPVVLSDGGVQCVGPTSGEFFCVGPLTPCDVVDGSASPQCCELVG